MNINATLLGELIAFIFFVWFCMKFIWPPLVAALDERKKVIADGLAASERGKKEQELAENRAKELLHDAKEQAADIIAHAQKRAQEVVEESKGQAKEEGERILVAAQAEIQQEVNQAREALRSQVVTLAVSGAGRVLAKEIDAQAHNELLDDLVSNL